MGNALQNANGTFCRTPDFNFFCLLSSFCFSFLSHIFEHIKYIKNHESQKNIRSYSRVFETTSNHSFQVPNRSYKVKHAKRFEEHITQPLKSIERRSSLPAFLSNTTPPPSAKSIQNPGKHLRELSVKIVNGFQLLNIFAKSSMFDIGRITNNTSTNQRWTAIN